MNIDQNKQLLSVLLLQNLIKNICYVHKIQLSGEEDMAHWSKKKEQVFMWTSEYFLISKKETEAALMMLLEQMLKRMLRNNLKALHVEMAWKN
jgi:hypothetical protein